MRIFGYDGRRRLVQINRRELSGVSFRLLCKMLNPSKPGRGNDQL